MADINLSFDEINFISFGTGLAVGWGSAYMLYRARHLLGAAGDTVSQRASSAQEFASRSADARYIGDLIRFCERDHLAGKAISLSKLLIEPRFIPAPELAAPPEDDVVRSVFHVVPRIVDQPYLHASYNVPSLSIDDLGKGHNAIALLGLQGSGRTTALHAIALWATGVVRFDPPSDTVQERLEAEEAAIDNDEERANRIRDRMQIEEMAMESIAASQGDTAKTAVAGRSFKHMTPIYAHFANVHPTRREFGSRVDPAEPLVRAIQGHVGRITAKSIARSFYQRLRDGNVLLLLDGFDDMPITEQRSKLDWLRAFLAEYDNNVTIVTGPATGYGDLVKTGLAPVFLRPWNDTDLNNAADRWEGNWSQITRSRRKVEFDERTLNYARSRNRALNPFEYTLKLWKTYDIQDSSNLQEQFEDLLKRYAQISNREALIQTAVLQLDNGYITAKQLEDAMLGRPAVTEEDINTLEGPPHVDDEIDEDIDVEDDELDEELADDLADEEAEGDEKPQRKKEPKEKVGKEYRKLIDQLYRDGLLVRYRGGRYQFRHPLIAAYIASLSLQQADSATLMDRAVNPAWENALAYANLHTPMDEIVQARLDAPPDALHNHVIQTARWLAYAPHDAPWRKGLLVRLGNMLVARDQYSLVRERVAAALVGTRDRQAQVFLRKSLNHAYPEVRRLSCLVAGAMRIEDHIQTLANRLGDEDPDVALAAGLALGAIGTDSAYEEMVYVLQGGSESLRQAVAEAFAAIPDVGYEVLFDAANHEDYMMRRAAVFGLRRINTPWALIAIYRRSIEDDQWYVRTAAEQALETIKFGDTGNRVQRYPAIESIPWMREWLNNQGDEAGTAVEADLLLSKALEEGDSLVQMLAAANIGQLGMIQHLNLLYRALRHRSEAVRDTAMRAIGDLQAQTGQPLPAPA